MWKVGLTVGYLLMQLSTLSAYGEKNQVTISIDTI